MAYRLNEEQKQFMVEFVPGHSYKEIAAEFSARFGVEYTTNQVRAYCKNHKLHTGRTGRFEKGHVPANKGKKVSPELYEKMKGTMFKAGQEPPNTLPVGTELELADGYVWVKVNDIPKAKKNVNWKQKQRLIYEQEYGPIPDGCIVTFLDGNNRNFDLDNLRAVTREQHSVLNKLGLRFTDKELTKVGIAIADMKIAKRNRKKNTCLIT